MTLNTESLAKPALDNATLASPIGRRIHPGSIGRKSKTALRLAVDLCVLSAALWLAFLLRFEGDLRSPRLGRLLVAWPWVIGLQYGMLALLRVPRFSWSSVGVRELPPIIWAATASSLVLLTMRYLGVMLVDSYPPIRSLVLPTSVILINATLVLVGISGVRTMRRLQRERSRRRRPHPKLTPTILIGAGRGGWLLARELDQRPELGIEPVAFVDDNPALIDSIVHGIPVVGTTADLPEITRIYGAEMALITIASADGRDLRRIAESCKATGVPTKTVPRVHEILDGKVKISQIRDVSIEELLGRAPIVIEDSAATQAVTGKVAMVTGAGGSIGAELCRQIMNVGPSALVLVERAEFNLYQIHRELSETFEGVEILPAVADICDVERMRELFEAHRPHVVFHAAAHKQVPMMELNPGEAVKNNVFGTRNVADLADEYGCERFVLISTDKAVNPTSVMGATKRLAELYVQELNENSLVRFVTVRFGNVLGSAGSVIPLFREQIARGGPVTVTHPEMERYFMTIPEASRLVLEAAGLGRGGELMLLDMGEPIKIKTLAEHMIRFSGLEPGVDIEIQYTGVRDGEKLYEELANEQELLEATACECISVLRSQNGSIIPIANVLEELSQPFETADELRERLRRVLPEYRLDRPMRFSPKLTYGRFPDHASNGRRSMAQ